MNIFGGRSDFFAVREKKFDRPPCVTIGLSLMGGPPEGGSPLGGTPP